MLPEELQSTGLTEAHRTAALARCQLLRLFLEEGVPLVRLAEANGLPLRTVRRWIRGYRTSGLAGLCRKVRADKSQRRMSPDLHKVVEGLALQKLRLSAALVHRPGNTNVFVSSATPVASTSTSACAMDRPEWGRRFRP